jgi:hypothetical protein
MSNARDGTDHMQLHKLIDDERVMCLAQHVRRDRSRFVAGLL